MTGSGTGMAGSSKDGDVAMAPRGMSAQLLRLGERAVLKAQIWSYEIIWVLTEERAGDVKSRNSNLYKSKQ